MTGKIRARRIVACPRQGGRASTAQHPVTAACWFLDDCFPAKSLMAAFLVRSCCLTFTLS
ncbi:MAG: hypothetical protein FWD31_06585 [Planctomycetaceae bacterium]|nr:hypothetical protein [Planctomycetaceae bacterium]